jgi:exopolyphosphatase/guanosine-5'-triphosphate,3'-diphosphate pyrophosphatase
VADARDRQLVPVERDLVITRLGEGVDRARRLAAGALARTVEAVGRYHERAERSGARRVRIAATSAVRDAANRVEFLAAVRDRTGIEPEVLSGEQEARLGFLGATSELDPAAGPFLVLDVGGGSTELVRGWREPEAWTSLDVGSVRLTERHVRSDPPTPAELAAVRADAARAAADARRTVGRGARTLVGLAGTITTLAAVALGLPGYDRERIHHARLPRARVDEVTSALARMTVAERRRLPAMPPGREDVIVAGAEILRAVMDELGFDEVLVSEADILDGLLLDLLAGER